MRFLSILFDQAEGPGDGTLLPARDEPACFVDLRLDQVAGAMTAGYEEYDLKPFFYTPLHDISAVRYRHEILRDLENKAIFACVTAFAEQMRQMRRQRAQAGKLHYQYQKECWLLDAVTTYCDAVRALASELACLDVRSRGLQAFGAYLTAYVASERFTTLASETQQRHDDLASVQYCVHIFGNRVTVSKYEGDPDYSAEIAETFARFRQEAVKDHLVTFPNWPEINHVEAQVLDLVARLYPNVFQALDQYGNHHQDYLDDTIGRFDREVQFYLAYLAYIAPFRSAGLPFCYPDVSTSSSKDIAARGAFDLALAARLVPEKMTVVCNDFALSDPERIIVVTGPNQGGKTTFARMLGQLPYLASLGLLVPGSWASLFLPDQIHTHFEREEDLATLRGKLEDELVRIHDILERATSRSIIVMNESFASTTLNDALVLGTRVMRQIIALGALCVYVTFVDELASLSETTVSMVSTVVRENPALRTYKIVRQPADGLAYAAAIAEKYGLTYETLRRRIASNTAVTVERGVAG